MIKLSGVLVAVAALGLAGCAVPQPGRVSDPPSSVASPSAEPSKAASMVAKIGGTVTYPDGVAVTIVSAARYQMGEFAAGGNPGAVGIKVTVKIANGSEKPLNLGLVTSHMHAGPNGVEASRVFDSASNVGMFSGTIAPSRAATAHLGFAVMPAELGQVSIDIRVGLRSAALFEGTVR
jgi:hypothetical protein